MMRFAYCFRAAVCLLLFMGTMPGFPAQEMEREQLKQAIEEHRMHIRAADSTGDAREAARQRIMLAPLVKPEEARRLYEAAAVIADSAELAEDEELRARQGLMELHRAKGNWRAAYEEGARVIELTAQWQQRQALLALDEEQALGQRAVAQRDSVLAELSAVRNDAALQLEALRQQQETWKWALIMVALVGALMLAAFVWSNGRSRKRMRADIEALRAELAASRVQPMNRVRDRPTPPSVVPPDPEPVVEAPRPISAKEPDRLVLDIFRTSAPERLSTLKQARAQGDTDKVVRVVHTLKPQLMALDPGRFGPLCASLTEPGASGDRMRWNAELDRLEQGLLQLLG